MRIRYHQLVGKPVLSADGTRLGRVHDLEAQGSGGCLEVTALLVGPAAFVRRIAFRLRPPGSGLVASVPWHLVGRIDGDAVHLRVARDAVAHRARVRASEREGGPHA